MPASVTEVQKALKGAEYPADRDDLVQLAEQNGADDEVLSALRDADSGRFDGPDQVMAALKGQVGGS
jgi:hypothetical protein